MTKWSFDYFSHSHVVIFVTAESWVKEDVPASTGLPPQVEGQLRCYLKLCINQVLWMTPGAPDVTHVRVRWWGETGEGTIFR